MTMTPDTLIPTKPVAVTVPPRPDHPPIIRAENLSVRYGDHRAFDQVTWTIARGRITALIGPSGCGKTSFLTCLNRLADLVPRCSVAGTLDIDGMDVLSAATDVIALRRRVGMIFQKPNPFPVSIRRNIALPLLDHRLCDRRTVDDHIERTLRAVGLWGEVKDRLNQSAFCLSGGQQQRLCLARALALKPDILLLDEPCSALDPISSGVVEDLIVSLRGRYTVVIVTHNLAQAKRIADDAAFFWLDGGAGRLIEHGPCRSVFENPAHPLTRAYIHGARG